MRLIDAEAIKYDLLPKIGDAYEDGYSDALADIRDAPTVDAVLAIRCKDCKHFEYNHFENASGIPLIVAHEICTAWGNGCKTSENGWCFMAEKKEGEKQ